MNYTIIARQHNYVCCQSNTTQQKVWVSADANGQPREEPTFTTLTPAQNRAWDGAIAHTQQRWARDGRNSTNRQKAVR